MGKKSKSAEDHERDGNLCLGMGLGVGALGVATAVTVGAVCPVCYFAVPALVGAGCFEKYQAKRSKDEAEFESKEPEAAQKPDQK